MNGRNSACTAGNSDIINSCIGLEHTNVTDDGMILHPNDITLTALYSTMQLLEHDDKGLDCSQRGDLRS